MTVLVCPRCGSTLYLYDPVERARRCFACGYLAPTS
jgi:ribosomal protein L37E